MSSSPQGWGDVIFSASQRGKDFVTISMLSNRLHARTDISYAVWTRSDISYRWSTSWYELCFDEDMHGYSCESSPKTVCIKCVLMTSIEYRCPYCRATFASFPQVSVIECRVFDAANNFIWKYPFFPLSICCMLWNIKTLRYLFDWSWRVWVVVLLIVTIITDRRHLTRLEQWVVIQRRRKYNEENSKFVCSKNGFRIVLTWLVS